MGTLLLKTRRVNFDTYNNLEEAYKITFGKEKIERILKRDNPSMHTINLVRNLFAHRGGLIDDKFSAETRTSKPFGSIKAGETARLDGKLVCSYTEVITDCTVGLLEFVDDWLQQNPK